MLLMILMEKKLLERFTKTNCKKQIKKNLELNIKFSKTQLSKMIQSGGTLGELIAAIPQGMFLSGKKY